MKDWKDHHCSLPVATLSSIFLSQTIVLLQEHKTGQIAGSVEDETRELSLQIIVGPSQTFDLQYID